LQRVVELSKIMSDINRVRILTLILRDKELCVCEICDTLELSQPLVSRHLKQMKEVKVLDSNKRGKWMIYTLISSPDSILLCFIDKLQKKVDSLPKLIVCESFT